jgi:polyribonucleotide nucleotidyltransferase
MKMHKVCRVKFWNEHRLDLPSWEGRKKQKTIRDKEAWATMTEDNKAIQRERQRIAQKNRRIKVLEHYGGSCTCCGETRYEFLAIDHINNDGGKHREEMGSKSGGRIYLWLITLAVGDVNNG